MEDKDSAYVNIIAVRKEDLDNLLLQELVRAYHSQEVADFVYSKFGNSLVLGFSLP